MVFDTESIDTHDMTFKFYKSQHARVIISHADS